MKQIRILLIDDNQDFAFLMKSVIQLLGYNIELAYDGAEGMEKAQEYRPDIILCDIGLPRMNGYEFARNIRENDLLRHSYLIALTGYARPCDIKQSTDSGFNRHLSKPIDATTISEIISDYVTASEKN